LRKTTSAIVQDKEGWYGLTLTATERDISDVKVHSGYSLDELKKMFERQPCAVALDDATGYLFSLILPFKGRRKISLVLGSQLEEMLPFPVEDMVIDFQELGTDGAVLAAAVPRSALADIDGRRQIRSVSLQSLAALYALKWLKLMPQENTVFLNCTGNSAVMMMFDRNRLVHLRHFFRSPQAGATISALKEIAEQTNLSDVRYLMVAGEDGPIEKQLIERALGIDVELLTLDEYVIGEDIPAQLWAGLGAALIALNPKGEINLCGERHHSFSGSSRIGLYASGGLAGLSLLVLGLSSLDLYLKHRTYDHLSNEPNRIYRTVFPKAPPVKDVVRTFEERIRRLSRAEGGGKDTGMSPLSLLDDISSKIDPQIDVRLSEFVADEKEFAIAGTTASFASIDKIRDALQRIKGTNTIELQNVDMAPGGQVRFRFRGKL
jgi:general secretion pathway protein L